jgi:hypothetical protein
MEVTLHPMPRWRDVVREQVEVVGLSLRREALVVAAILGVGTLIVLAELTGGGPGLDSNDLFPLPVISFLFPFAVWKSEDRYGPSFLWTLPVERRRLALAKMFAGGVWLMAGVALFVSWLLTLALIADVSLATTIIRVPITATIGMYLMGSALVLGLRHPLRWLIGIGGGFLLFMNLSEALGRTANGEWRLLALSGLVYGPYGLRQLLISIGFIPGVQNTATALRTLPALTQWAITAFVWWGVGLAMLWVALSRHRETRRK